MSVTQIRIAKSLTAMALITATAGCGEFTRQGRSPSVVVVELLEAASGAEPDEFGGVLRSDVVTVVGVTTPGSDEEVPVPTVFNDVGRVTMSLVLKDPGVPGLAALPSLLNQVTFNRYRVEYQRADGRNVQGVDVPFAFDSAVTFTVPAEGNVTASFDLVRHSAKEEPPLLGLARNNLLISTIATVTFYGRDQAGNDVSAVARIGVTFGNFGDPQ